MKKLKFEIYVGEAEYNELKRMKSHITDKTVEQMVKSFYSILLRETSYIKFNDIDDNDAPSLDSDNEFIKSTKAQKETFRLINTIKQLNHTVNNLAPALKQGANIIDKFKKLNLIAD